jgi:glycerol dehydrogenase
MTTFTLPSHYISKPGAISGAGSEIAKRAKTVLVVGSKTPLRLAGLALSRGLQESDVLHKVFEHNGYPSLRAAQEIKASALELQADALVSLGGGRIHDVTKAAATLAGVPVISVPTQAATCASWASVSILYDDNGVYTAPHANPKSPILIIADTDIIASASPRYLRSGAADALARWYEQNGHLTKSKTLHSRWLIKQSELIREFILSEGAKAIDDLESGKPDITKVRELIDVNILLTGFFVSPRNDEETQIGGFAHPFCHKFSVLEELHKTLHGEQIAFFLIAAAIYESVPASELEERLAVFSALKQPLTLDALGLSGDSVDNRLLAGARSLLGATDGYGGRIKLSADGIVKLLHETDRVGREHEAKRARRGFASISSVAAEAHSA